MWNLVDPKCILDTSNVWTRTYLSFVNWIIYGFILNFEIGAELLRDIAPRVADWDILINEEVLV